MRLMSRIKVTACARAVYGFRLALAALFALTAVIVGATAAQALNPRPICEICRRYTDKSPGRVVAFIELGNHVKKLDTCSIFCFIELLEDQVKEPSVVYIADYATFGTEDHIPLKADQAWFLFNCDSGDDQKINEPYTYAFASEDLAREYQDELGGELLSWDELVDKVRELTDEWEPEGSNYEYRPLRERRNHKHGDNDDDG